MPNIESTPFPSQIRNDQSVICDNFVSWFPWVFLSISTVVFGSVSLIYPFGRDQLYYAFLGDALLHGKIFYRDVPMMQMPLTGVIHALAMILFGRNMTAIRILDLFWTMGTSCFIFLFARKAFQRFWIALLAGYLYSFIYYTNDFWQTAQVDGFLNLPICAALYLVMQGIKGQESGGGDSGIRNPSSGTPSLHPLLLLSAGALIGLALFFKYTIIMLLPAVGLLILGINGWRSANPGKHYYG